VAAVFADLITEVTEAQYWTQLTARYDSASPPTPWRTWSLRAADLSTSRFTTQALSELRSVVAYSTSGMFLEYGEGKALELFARSQYQVTPSGSVSARGRFLITAAAGAPAQTFALGQVTAGTPGAFSALSQLYSNVETGAIETGGTLMLDFEAQVAGDGANLPVGAPLDLKTSFAGLTITCPASGPATRIGTGNASLLWYCKDSGVTVSIVNNGASLPLTCTANLFSKVCTIQLETNGGGTAISTAEQVRKAVKAALPIGALAIGNFIIECKNGGDGTGTVAITSSPVALPFAGTWLERAGAPPQTETQIKALCATRWDTLGGGAGDGAPASDSSTVSALEYWGRQIPAGYAASPVDKFKAYSNLDPATGLVSGGVVAVYIAGIAGPLGAADVAAVTANFESPQKYSYGCRLDVRSAVFFPVAVTGTIYYRLSSGRSREQVQTSVAAAIAAYQRTIDIGEVPYPTDITSRMHSADFEAIRNIDLLTPPTPPAVTYKDIAVLDIASMLYVGV
jgi:hypothetical protein